MRFIKFKLKIVASDDTKNVETVKSRLSMQIKDNIDLRVDELKAELESAREKLHRQVDLVCGRSIQ